MNNTPRFVIVGHPNKGKSSLVATLTQNDRIGISPLSGTTLDSTFYPMRVTGRLCYELVDTPGFQRAGPLLELLKEKAESASVRAAAVSDWLNSPDAESRFPDEFRLLQPIMGEDSAIIYVVDGSRPYRADYESEMEILRWTGRPRMAVINPISGSAFVPEWRAALDQYFSVVREFNPVTATFEEQIRLLQVFATLQSGWEASISSAVEALTSQRRQKLESALNTLISGVEDILSEEMKVPLPPQESLAEKAQTMVLRQYRKKIVALEAKTRNGIREALFHSGYQDSSEPPELKDMDLFDEKQWRIWGLPKARLAWLAAGSGGLAGAIVDVGLGGSSLLMGAALGSIVSGGSVLIWGDDIAKVKLAGTIPMGYQEWKVGPVRNLAFAWVMLNRLLFLTETLYYRNHADRATVEGMTPEQLQSHFSERLERLGNKDKYRLNLWLQSGGRRFSQRETLQKLLLQLLDISF